MPCSLLALVGQHSQAGCKAWAWLIDSPSGPLKAFCTPPAHLALAHKLFSAMPTPLYSVEVSAGSVSHFFVCRNPSYRPGNHIAVLGVEFRGCVMVA